VARLPLACILDLDFRRLRPNPPEIRCQSNQAFSRGHLIWTLAIFGLDEVT